MKRLTSSWNSRVASRRCAVRFTRYTRSSGLSLGQDKWILMIEEINFKLEQLGEYVSTLREYQPCDIEEL
ncbi:hypothetical protein [Methanosarcina acetivorans]|uniref:hypothetical protein n=1 Tax=Methanosarcina acetivorans TaxID=2214 RepID=UPI001D0440F9|nr:hypothetical protein [Methanosarcina acetivorans]